MNELVRAQERVILEGEVNLVEAILTKEKKEYLELKKELEKI